MMLDGDVAVRCNVDVGGCRLGGRVEWVDNWKAAMTYWEQRVGWQKSQTERNQISAAQARACFKRLLHPCTAATVCKLVQRLSPLVAQDSRDLDPEMSSSSSSDMVETDLEAQAAPQPAMPEVMLSFDNSVGGAWDDRELIRAYDAALDEFHVS